MPTDIHPAIAADEQLIRAAMLRAGAQIHSIVGIVAMYRSAIQDSRKTARFWSGSCASLWPAAS